MTGRHSGEEELLNAGNPCTHSQHGLKYIDGDLSSQLEALIQVHCWVWAVQHLLPYTLSVLFRRSCVCMDWHDY
jgi:hypothetical protein